jgi:hypothetical protein
MPSHSNIMTQTHWTSGFGWPQTTPISSWSPVFRPTYPREQIPEVVGVHICVHQRRIALCPCALANVVTRACSACKPLSSRLSSATDGREPRFPAAFYNLSRRDCEPDYTQTQESFGMRLINTTTLEVTEFVGRRPRYAILSHVWRDGEVLLEDIKNGSARGKQGFAKIANFCAIAKSEGFDFGWVDTCCIDKFSSTELSEAINSMFAWYRDSGCCFAYLDDVELDANSEDVGPSLKHSRWFYRGWVSTLSGRIDCSERLTIADATGANRTSISCYLFK